MNKHENIVNLYFKSMKTMAEIESIPRAFGIEDLLYSSEIHTVVAIGKHPGCNLTELAHDLDITKGGAGKFVKKLLEKGLITKSQLPENKKEVVFHITEKGKVAYEHHELFEQKRFGEIFKLMDAMEEEDIEKLEDFLIKLNQILEAGD